MEHYKAPQPRETISKARSDELITLFVTYREEMDKLWAASNNPYYGWKEFEMRFRTGVITLQAGDNSVKPHEAWFLLGIRRSFGDRRKASFSDTNDNAFYWSKTFTYERDLRHFDMQLGGNTETELLGGYTDKQDRFLRQSLIEEAIASSQLEGATTSREKAKKMIAENRQPLDKSEWMIFNNFKTIQRIEEETVNLPLSRELLLDLHKTLTDNTFSEEDVHKVGRFRKDEDEIVVTRFENGIEYIAHVPPDEKRLQKDLDALIKFANSSSEEANGVFVHPIVKAILIHFWFAYIHPFADGNGRMARMLFYWYLIRNGYWLIKYVPVSTVIKNSQTQYGNSFIYSEQYGNDLTYFLEYNFAKVKLAVQMFGQHVERVKKKSRNIDTILVDKDLNERQKQILHYLGGKNEDSITAKKHSNFQQIGWLTASLDLKKLQEKGYLYSEKRGREVSYKVTKKFMDLFDQ